MKSNFIYLDYAANTPVDQEVLNALRLKNIKFKKH